MELSPWSELSPSPANVSQGRHHLDVAGLLGLPSLGTELRSVLDEVSTALDSGVEHFDAVLARSIASGGKMLRTALLLASAAANGAPPSRRLHRAAAAVELVQLGSLIHDDIMDKSVVRRGERTIYGAEGADVALMAGDLVLARSGLLAVSVGGDAPGLLSTALVEVCRGQILESADVGSTDRTIDRYLASVADKTAALFACACELGAHVAGAPADECARHAAYGRSLGIAFQITDDILDLIGCPTRLGKPVGVDLEARVYTLPVLLALQSDLGPRLRHHLDRSDLLAARQDVVASGAISTARDVALEHARHASGLVSAGDDGRRCSRLAGFPEAYVHWALSDLVKDDHGGWG